MSHDHRSSADARALRAQVRAAIPDGTPLDAGARQTLEHGFDVDLSAIRVHHGPRADGLARSLGADAFAAGPQIFFRQGAYRPGTEAGLRLLAHEVAHSIQQARDPSGGTPPAPGAELLADLAADLVLRGRPVLRQRKP